jgi:vesicle-associated membrane protein 1/vesicle-associated membrane protein 2
VNKSENLNGQSYDIRETARKVKNKMWWENKKVTIGAAFVIIVIIGIIVLIIAT